MSALPWPGTVPAMPALRALAADPEWRRATVLLAAGDYLFGPQRRPRLAYLVVSGLIRLIDPAGAGRPVERTLDWLGPGQIVGWAGLSRRIEGPVWAVAERDSRLIPLPTRALARRIGQDPRLALELLAQLTQRLYQAYLEAGEMIRLEAPQRLAQCLRRLARVGALVQTDGPWTVVRLTHAALARRSGISRETVSLILSRWSRQGLVKTGRGRLAFQPDRLAELVTS